MQKVLLNLAIFAILSGCAETLPPGKSQQEAKFDNKLHQYPVLATVDEVDVNQLSNTIRVDSETVIVLNDINNEFDNSAVRSNQAIKARSLPAVSIKASGDSRILQHVYYNAGVIVSVKKYEYDAAGVRTKRIHYNGAGIDGEWFTADDVVKDYSLFDSLQGSIHAHVINYDAPGLDAKWFTADDDVRYYMADVVDTAGTVVATARVNQPGTDGNWFTADDIVRSISTENTRADGSSEWIQYRSAGPDLNWSTLADNVIGHYALTSVNTAGQKDRHVFYINPGPDATTYTSDDMVGFYHNFTYNTQNLLNHSILYSAGSGVDATWFTADDPVSGCENRDYDGDNKLTRSTDADPGVDVACFTADDVITHYHDFAYDSTGHLLTTNSYAGSGLDATWFTSDDELVKTSQYEPK